MARKKKTDQVARSIWIEIKTGDVVYLDYRLNLKRGRWRVAEVLEEGFFRVEPENRSAGRVSVPVRADCITGWFISRDRMETDDTPTGKYIVPPRRFKETTDRGTRLIDVE